MRGGGAFLEVGCGTGTHLAALAGFTTGRAVGLDPVPEMLAHAACRPGDTDLVRGRAERLPFDDAAFDLVFCVDVLHHVGDRPAFFAEAARVLAPGGVFCAVTDSHEDIRRRRPLSSHFPETIEVELVRYAPVPVVHAELDAAGLRVLPATRVERTHTVTSADAYRDRAFSSLHLLEESVFRRRLRAMEDELTHGPITGRSLYTLVWASAPG